MICHEQDPDVCDPDKVILKAVEENYQMVWNGKESKINIYTMIHLNYFLDR